MQCPQCGSVIQTTKGEPNPGDLPVMQELCHRCQCGEECLLIYEAYIKPYPDDVVRENIRRIHELGQRLQSEGKLKPVLWGDDGPMYSVAPKTSTA